MDIITILIFVGVFILFIIGIFSYFYFFRDKITIKQNISFQSRCNFLCDLLDNKITNYLKRLEYISQNNPTYIEKYTSFVDVVNTLNIEAKEIKQILSIFQDNIYQNNISKVRKQIKINRRKILSFEKKVTNLADDLMVFFIPEENQRCIFSQLLKQIENIKNFFNNNENRLLIFRNKYNALFNNFSNFSEKFKHYLDIGEFNESKKILNKLEIFVENFSFFNNVINDNIGVLLEIFFKIDIFNKKFNSLIEKHDLYDLIFNNVFLIKNDLQYVFKKMKKFDLENINENLKNINSVLDKTYFSLIDEEKASKTFLKEIRVFDKQLYFLEQNFNQLQNFFKKISKVYILNNFLISKFHNLKKKVTSIEATKSICFNTSNTPKCYFFLLNKINETRKVIKDTNNNIFSLEKEVISLKSDMEKYYILTYNFYFRLKKVEKMIRDINIDYMHKKYEKEIQNIYDVLNETMDILTIIPINTNKICDNFNFLNLKADSFINKISKEIKTLRMAENAILYINNDNAVFVNTSIKNNFFKCEAEQVLLDIKQVLNR
ncbi:MAG: hypothetical protein J6Y70_01785 [Bacilli bacterium]|nr:hypothetical protein [Bacilli bacterium]